MHWYTIIIQYLLFVCAMLPTKDQTIRVIMFPDPLSKKDAECIAVSNLLVQIAD